MSPRSHFQAILASWPLKVQAASIRLKSPLSWRFFRKATRCGGSLAVEVPDSKAGSKGSVGDVIVRDLGSCSQGTGLAIEDSDKLVFVILSVEKILAVEKY